MTNPTTPDAGFSAESPKEDGWYWIKGQTMEGEPRYFPSLRKGLTWDTFGYIHLQTAEEMICFGWKFGPRIPTPSESASQRELPWVGYGEAMRFPDGTFVAVRRTDGGPIKLHAMTWYRNDWDAESAVNRQFLRLDGEKT